MLSWAIFFFVLAIIAAVFGFGGVVTGTFMGAAKLLVLVFVVLALISFVSRGSTTPSSFDGDI